MTISIEPTRRLIPLTVFGLNAKKDFPGLNPGEFTPAATDHYLFREDLLFLGMSWLEGSGPKGKNLSLYGPQGAGKSSFVFELAAKAGWEVFHFSAGGSAESGGLVGKVTLDKGDMKFDPGPLLLAAARGGILLIDEVDLLSPDEAAALNAVLDDRPIPVPDGVGIKEKYLRPRPEFRIAVTSNTGGIGDRNRQFAGAKKQHGGFLDRFRSARIGYLSETEELSILNGVCPSLDPTVAKSMVKVAAEVRRQFEAAEIGVTYSTRSLHQWSNDFLKLGGSSLKKPLSTTFRWSLPVCSVEDATAVDNVLALHLGSA
ncbi:hypothetical protein BJI67_16105 (plasmid) [Acidihalobacter aeolianus]|uniref:ATPase dynein-related AAA domain-containing protein n=1 Tax=Acidihalobacter aeolianus TaxID=2792603 RepID=A0A1D8KCS6_9GAMM|nr:AAA family ATPase [Acidihalobacter aeolianus]AOV18763.1 hypothetical protein BJI67_16105 [Acidihalobacter aeolianus]